MARLLRAFCTMLALPAALGAAGLAPIVAASRAAASVPLEVKAFSGVTAPGAAPGLILNGFGNAVVNAIGDVAFVGYVADPVLEIGGAGVFGPDAGGAPTVIAFDFEPVPDLPPGTEFRFQSTYYPRLNDAGQIVFQANLSGPEIQVSENTGIWRWSAGGGLEQLVRGGDPVPDAGPGITLGEIWGGLSTPTIGADGDVAFTGSLVPSGETALFSANAAGTTTLAATAGMPVPGVPGAEFSYVYQGASNQYGAMHFGALFDGPGVSVDENDSGSFSWDPLSGLALQVRAGDPAPSTPPGVVFAWAGTAYPNDAGDFAYLTWLSGPGVSESDDSALYGPGTSGELVLIAREGQPAPGTEPGTVFQELHFVGGGAVINANGQVAFAAELIGPSVTAENGYGIWLFDPTSGATELCVRLGDPAPEFPGLTLATIWYPILNDRGDLVFHGVLAGPGVTPDTERAIFALEGGVVARKVVRAGDLVEFGPGDLRPLGGFSMLDGAISDVPGVGQLSDTGYLVFNSLSPDGTHAIVVATLPEPGGAGGLAAGAMLLAWLRRVKPRAK